MISDKISAKDQPLQSYIFMHVANFRYDYLETVKLILDVHHRAFYFTRRFFCCSS